MRILHIGKFGPPFAGGMEYFLGDLLPALHPLGIEACALVHEHPTARLLVRKDPRNVYFHRAACHGSLLYAPVSPTFPFTLHRLVSRFRPHLLHLHMPNTSVFWALFLRSVRRLPWVVHWHSDVVPSRIDPRLALAYRFYRPFEEALLSRAAVVLATSPPYLESSLPLKPWKQKCRVVPLGLNDARLPMITRSYKEMETLWPFKGLRLLVIGRLTYYKGHEYLIQAMTRVPGASLLIVGEGEKKSQLKGMITNLGLSDRVQLTGYVSPERLQTLLQCCDCLCLPSVERTEAFGLVLLEAMRYGKAIIASNVKGSGIGWVVTHQQNGLLVPPGDADALAAHLSLLVAHPDRCVALGKEGFKRFSEVFQIERVAGMVRDVYGEMMAGVSVD